MKKINKKIAIYQAKNGAIELTLDESREIIWANKKQIAQIFGIDRSVVSRHIKNVFNDAELDSTVVCANFAHTTEHGAIQGKTQTKKVDFYSLDIILAVGYRTNSVKAIEFRKWATKTLKQHIIKGYTLNKKILKQNHQEFLQAVEDIKLLSKDNKLVGSDEVLELIKTFSSTWFNLEQYDKDNFPKKGSSKKSVNIKSQDLYSEVEKLKQDLIKKKQATELFAQEKKQGSLEGILGNVLQSVFGKDAYETIEKKAAHLLYFIIKNHPFNDGNKRTGAFAFLWFLQKMNFNFREKISPETLTALTLFVAESNPKEKEKMIGLILLLLKK